MKLLSIAVPCYNSAAYMSKCIESLLAGGDEVEILIVDDGSTKDDTARIADEYEKNYPGICRAIHQENGGHGEAVNTGLRNATGVYFKVVDSDDYVDADAYRAILDTLRRYVYGSQTLDMLISNFVYDKQGGPQKDHELPDGPAQGPAVYMEGCESIYPGAVYPDAFGDLPDPAS